MSMDRFPSRFTPTRTDPEVRERINVQREVLARDAEAKISDGILSANKYHLLFVGPRGSGKTHLIALIHHRLSRRADLREKMRIAVLGESETVGSYPKLLWRLLQSLHESYPDEFPLISARDLGPADDRGRARLLERLLVERLGDRSLLVAVENLDLLLKSLGEDGRGAWRAFLQEKAVVNTLATSTRLTPEISARTTSFHGFFRVIHLEPIRVAAAVELLSKIAREIGQSPELEAFLASDEGMARARAIEFLTDGNPRLLVMLSGLIDRDSLDELVTPFVRLVDELAPDHGERIAGLSEQQREIVEFLARSKTTASVKSIAEELFISHQTAASQLKGLVERGFVSKSSRGRESLHEIADPLARICLQVKLRAADPVRPLVSFLRDWFRGFPGSAKGVTSILNAGRDLGTWDALARGLIRTHSDRLSKLGVDLVRTLADIPRAGLSTTSLATWRNAWLTEGRGLPELDLPLRLFETGMKFHETGDRGVLLDLVLTERSLVLDALGFDEKIETEGGPSLDLLQGLQ